jgi:hypothetical protein
MQTHPRTAQRSAKSAQTIQSALALRRAFRSTAERLREFHRSPATRRSSKCGTPRAPGFYTHRNQWAARRIPIPRGRETVRHSSVTQFWRGVDKVWFGAVSQFVRPWPRKATARCILPSAAKNGGTVEWIRITTGLLRQPLKLVRFQFRHDRVSRHRKRRKFRCQTTVPGSNSLISPVWDFLGHALRQRWSEGGALR